MDQAGGHPDGPNHARPRTNTLTPRRVEVFTKLIADTLATRDMIRPHTFVEVSLVGGGFYQVPFEEVTVTEWCRILAAEVAPSGQAQKRAEAALENITLMSGESWMAAARRLVLYMRAVTADETKPHASEERYFWRHVASKHVSELCERAVNLFSTSESYRNGLEALLVQNGTEIKQLLTPMHVDAIAVVRLHGGPRASGSHIFDRLVKALLTRWIRYPIAAAPGGRKRDSIAALAQSQRLLSGQSTPKGPPTTEERRRGDRPPARGSTKGWRKNLEAVRDSACAALMAADTDRVYEDEEEEEEDEKYATDDRPPIRPSPTYAHPPQAHTKPPS